MGAKKIEVIIFSRQFCKNQSTYIILYSYIICNINLNTKPELKLGWLWLEVRMWRQIRDVKGTDTYEAYASQISNWTAKTRWKFGIHLTLLLYPGTNIRCVSHRFRLQYGVLQSSGHATPCTHHLLSSLFCYCCLHAWEQLAELWLLVGSSGIWQVVTGDYSVQQVSEKERRAESKMLDRFLFLILTFSIGRRQQLHLCTQLLPQFLKSFRMREQRDILTICTRTYTA